MLPRQAGWYKDAVIYEVHVRAFCDSVGDGSGNFRGLTQKLDYLQDLGITAIWLLPFYPSPLRDDGYDIADYTSIHAEYGTLEAFDDFLLAAHARGLRVITELVINHTSEQHPWFQRARRAPVGSSERDFYVWSDSPEKYSEARIIFKDFETSNWAWDKVAHAYYWHRFYSHQPDLNFDNPAVWEALFPVLDFWFQKGVDGLRLDAVPYLFEREETNCENLPETHGFLKALRRHVDEKFPDRMLLAEANQWPEDSAAYFGSGDECHMAFHFPVMPRLFMAMHSEDRLPIVDIMEQTPHIPESCQWALFLRNHDELTLEMVTDEERDSMYRAYAVDPRARINLGIRRRLAPLLGNNRRRIELMNGLLFSLPGTPVLYYGDEIGMGDNIYLGDRNGVRTPMQWSADRNAGFSRANPQKLYLPIIIDPEYHYEAVNVEAQQNNPNSLLWWTKRLIGLRRMHQAFSRGTLEFLRPLNRRVLAFLRKTDDETLLVVANLSRFVQCAELELSAHDGSVPIELFGAAPFPPVTKQPYQVMLGPHSFYWFSLSPAASPAVAQSPDGSLLPEVFLTVPWEELDAGLDAAGLEQALIPYLMKTIFHFRPRGSRLRTVRLRESIPFPYPGGLAHHLLLDVDWAGGEPETCWLPVALIDAEAADAFAASGSDGRIAHVADAASVGTRPPDADVLTTVADADSNRHGVRCICDATVLPDFNWAIIDYIRTSHHTRRADSELAGVRTTTAWDFPHGAPESLPVRRASADYAGLPLLFGEAFVLKLLPHIEPVNQPERELGRWLTESRPYRHAARWLGSLEFRRRREAPITLASVHAYVPNEGNAWQFTLDEISLYFDRVLALPDPTQPPPPLDNPETFRAPESTLPADVVETLAGYLNTVRLLAERLGELHLITSAAVEDPHFSPEEFSGQYQRSLYQTMRNLTSKAMHELRQSDAALLPEIRTLARDAQQREPQIHARFRRLVERRLGVWRIRIHGDCHLGQLLRSGSDFVFIDFEGNPKSAFIRRHKRSPLHDVVGLLHSFDFAATAALNSNSYRRGRTVGVVRPEDYHTLTNWTRFWRTLVQRLFVSTYRRKVAGSPFLAIDDADFDLVIDALLIERSLAEIRTQLVENPAAVSAALETLLRYLDEPWDRLATAAVP